MIPPVPRTRGGEPDRIIDAAVMHCARNPVPIEAESRWMDLVNRGEVQ
jgi:hypothetical protein